MMVAWHEMPGNLVLISSSRRGRYDRSIGASECLGSWINPDTGNHTVPYGTDHVRAFSRHFMPGYHHLVPPGLRLRFFELLRMAGAVGRSRRSRRFRRFQSS
jgi:hypothetical protein